MTFQVSSLYNYRNTLQIYSGKLGKINIVVDSGDENTLPFLSIMAIFHDGVGEECETIEEACEKLGLV